MKHMGWSYRDWREAPVWLTDDVRKSLRAKTAAQQAGGSKHGH